jgi:Cu+-exporting ATPase
MTEKSYAITGMTCAACAAAVKRAVSRMDGVLSVEVNIATEKMDVAFEEGKLAFNDIKETVEDAGYGIIEPLSFKKAELLIEGMSCAACSAAVERVTKRLDGVQTAQVNLTTNRGVFEYDPSKVKLSEIKAAIEDAGYAPRELEGEKTRDHEQERRVREIKVMRLRLAVAAVCAAPILYLAMSHMFPGLGVPIPAFMSPHHRPLVFALVQLILTIPVMIAGSRFYTRGFKTLFKGAPNNGLTCCHRHGQRVPCTGLFATAKICTRDVDFTLCRSI